jgi:hypothetical protein
MIKGRNQQSDSAWLEAFQSHADGSMPFVQFCDVDQLRRENAVLRRRSNSVLWGEPNAAFPPGDVDPSQAYLIGFTDYCDSGIFVDMRPNPEPRIIYENLNPLRVTYVIAFPTIASFVAFYRIQHDSSRK